LVGGLASGIIGGINLWKNYKTLYLKFMLKENSSTLEELKQNPPNDELKKIEQNGFDSAYNRF
jgi:hypothetical protein